MLPSLSGQFLVHRMLSGPHLSKELSTPEYLDLSCTDAQALSNDSVAREKYQWHTWRKSSAVFFIRDVFELGEPSDTADCRQDLANQDEHVD